MDEITTMIIDFIVKYGWQLGVCAIAGIFLLGAIKCTGLFDKIANTQLRKFSYIAISFILSCGASAIYLVITKTFNWAGFGVISGAILMLNQAVYQIYEDLGIRAVWQALLNKIKFLCSGKNKKIAMVIDNLSIDDMVKILEQKRQQRK